MWLVISSVSCHADGTIRMAAAGKARRRRILALPRVRREGSGQATGAAQGICVCVCQRKGSWEARLSLLLARPPNVSRIDSKNNSAELLWH